MLYQTSNETQFIENIKLEMTELFGDINRTNLYFAKKTIRKILRLANKNAKYSGIVTTNIELLMHFCKELNNTGLDFKKSTVLNNLYNAQIKKIKESLSTLHEDIQYDYQKDLEILTQ